MTEAEVFLRGKGWTDRDFGLSGIDRLLRSDNFLDPVREEYISTFGFAVLDSDTVELLLKYVPILEVGAGSGYWAYELSRAGGDVIATDSFTGKYSAPFSDSDLKWKLWTGVERLAAVDAIRKYPGRTLLIVWPDYLEDWASDALSVYEGDVVVYAGEDVHGATASELFFSRLKSGFDCISSRPLVQLTGISDCLFIYQRRREKEQ